MQGSHSRYLFNLYGLKSLNSSFNSILWGGLALFLAFSPSILRGQTKRGNYNFLDRQNQDYYFGITLGYNQSDYKVYRGKNFNANDSINVVESIKGDGFNLQIVTNLKIGNQFDLRFLPGFSFISRTVNYDQRRRNVADKPLAIESVLVELPFHLRYTSAPYNDKRMFVVGGVKYSYDIQSKSRARTIANSLRISPTDFQVELGAGIQMFFPYFTFSPEFKVSHGLGNILIYQGNLPENTLLEKLMSRTFTISLHFEG